ncbi:MAG: isoprenylcysteine carboxylmethyltransferase family protein [Hyphomicrobiaceae bacterium]
MSEATTDRPSTFPWPPVLLAAAVLIAVGLDRWVLRLPVPWADMGAIHFIGMVLLLAGVILVLWAAFQFPRHATSIRPDRGSNALVAGGPYAFSRNPIYLGEAIALLGGGISFNRLWLIVVVPAFMLVVTRLAIEREEAYLERRFGSAFSDYKARVRRWI